VKGMENFAKEIVDIPVGKRVKDMYMHLLELWGALSYKCW